jgi:hypothetical protein
MQRMQAPCVYMSMNTQMHAHAHMHNMCTYVHTCALTYLCTHINGYIYKCTHTHTHTYKHTHTHTYTCTYEHTHAHTNLLLLLADNLPAAVRKGPSGVGKLPAAIGQ